MSKNSSAKYHQDNKERLQKNVRGRNQSLSKEENEKKTIWSRAIQKSTRKCKSSLSKKTPYWKETVFHLENLAGLSKTRGKV